MGRKTISRLPNSFVSSFRHFPEPRYLDGSHQGHLSSETPTITENCHEMTALPFTISTTLDSFKTLFRGPASCTLTCHASSNNVLSV